METLDFWILSGIIAVLIAIIGFLLRERFKSIIDKLTELIDSVNKLASTMALQDQSIHELDDRLTGTRAELKDLECRVREVEQTCAKCK